MTPPINPKAFPKGRPTPAMVRKVWEALGAKASARIVAAELNKRDYDIGASTVDRYRRDGWRATQGRSERQINLAIERERLAVEAGRIGLGEELDREIRTTVLDASKMGDAELMMTAVRETNTMLVAMSRYAREHAGALVAAQPEVAGRLAASLSTALAGSLEAYKKALDLRMETARTVGGSTTDPKQIEGASYSVVEERPSADPLRAEIDAWARAERGAVNGNGRH